MSIFSGGECHVRLSPSDVKQETTVWATLASANDILYLLLTIDAIRRLVPECIISLTIPYIPMPAKIEYASKVRH